jgi:hypothetical protein
VAFTYHTETVKIVPCDSAFEKVSIDVAGLDDIFTDFDSALFLICNTASNKICIDLPLSIIFVNILTNYLTVNMQLINFGFYQLCLATSLLVFTALLDSE